MWAGSIWKCLPWAFEAKMMHLWDILDLQAVRTAGKFSAAPEEFSHRSLDTGTRLEKEAGSEEKTYFVDAVFLGGLCERLFSVTGPGSSAEREDHAAGSEI